MNERKVDYDSIAERYDRRYQHEEDSGVAAFLFDFVMGADRVLEVGCGTGHWLGLLAERVPLVAGIDPSAGMLRQARLGLHAIPLVRARAESLPFESEGFDRIFSINAFQHFSDKVQFVAEAKRVLGPKGGLLTIGLDPHTGLDTWWIYDYFAQTLEIDKERYPPTTEIRGWMDEAGFRDCFTKEIEHISGQEDPESADRTGRFDRSSTSQLTVLNQDGYEAGMSLLRKDIDAAKERGEDLMLTTDLRLYATVGWRE